MSRSNHRRYSAKKVFLKSVANFTGKHLCFSLFFNKVAGLKALKDSKQHGCFPVKFAKFVRMPILKNIC